MKKKEILFQWQWNPFQSYENKKILGTIGLKTLKRKTYRTMKMFFSTSIGIDQNLNMRSWNVRKSMIEIDFYSSSSLFRKKFVSLLKQNFKITNSRETSDSFLVLICSRLIFNFEGLIWIIMTSHNFNLLRKHVFKG